MRPFTGPLHLFRAFVPCINQCINVRFSHLTRIRLVGLITCIIIDKIRLIPVEILIQPCQLRAMPFVSEIVPQHGQFRECILGVTMPQFPFELVASFWSFSKILKLWKKVETFEVKTSEAHG